jgi:hypothetical protein
MFGSLLFSAIACGGDDDADEQKTGTAFGPVCEKYYGAGMCCVELAGASEEAVKACGTAKTGVLDGIAQGHPASNFEAACQAAMDTSSAPPRSQGTSPTVLRG